MNESGYQGYLIGRHKVRLLWGMVGQLFRMCLLFYLLAVLALLFLRVDFTFQMVPAPYRDLAWKWPLARLEQALSRDGTFLLHSETLPHWWSGYPLYVEELNARQVAAIPYGSAFTVPQAHWVWSVVLSFSVWPLYLLVRRLRRVLTLWVRRAQPAVTQAIIRVKEAGDHVVHSRLWDRLCYWTGEIARQEKVRAALCWREKQGANLRNILPAVNLGSRLATLRSVARSTPGTVALVCLVQVVILYGIIHVRIDLKYEMVPAAHRELALKWPLARLQRYLGINGDFSLHSNGAKHYWNQQPTRVVQVTAKELVTRLPYSRVFHSRGAHWGRPFLWAAPVWFLFFAACWKSRREAQAMEADQHLRGARLRTERELAETCDDGILYVGSIRISEDFSHHHLLIAGQSGSGKTFLTVQHLVAIQKAKRRALVNDFKGSLLERYFRKDRDQILNPLDRRGIKWTLFNDIKTILDLATVIGILIPLGKDNEFFWTSAARDVLRGAMAYCYRIGLRTNADLCRVLASPIDRIAQMCLATEAGWAGYRYLQDPHSKMAEGIMAVLTVHVNWLEFAPDGDFSLREWVKTPGDATVFMTSLEEAADILRPYLSLVTDLVVKQILSLPEIEAPEASIYLQLDELSNMHRLSSVSNLITAGRSKGAVVEIGIQDISGLVRIYGQEETRTIINNCGNKMIMNLGESEGAELCSALCGEEDYLQASTTYSIDPDGRKVTETHTRQQKTRRVVMPTQIMRLGVGRGYFMFPGGNPALVRVPKLRENAQPVTAPKMILREGLSMEELKIRNDEATARAREVLTTPPPPEMIKIHEEIGRELKTTAYALETQETLEIDFKDELSGGE